MKVQGSAALRIVAFAVALAVVLGLASVMFSVTASAEDVTSSRVTLEDGTQVPTINGFSIIGSKSVTNIMIDYVNKTYGDGCIFLVAQDKTSKEIYYTRYPQLFFHDKEYIYCYFPGGYDCSAPYVTAESSVYDYLYIDDSFKAIHNGYNKSFSPSFYDKSLSAVSPNLSNLNYYWCYTNEIKWDHKNSCSLSTIVGYSDNSGFQEAITPNHLPSAEFLSFKGTESSGLCLIDWVTAGQQYPVIDFRIDDKGNYHKYALRISGNSNYAEILKGIWDRQEIKEAASAASNAVGVFLLLKAAASLGTKAVVSIAGAATPIGALFLNVPMHDMSGYVMLAAQNKLVQEYDTLSYDDIRTLTSDNMNFSEGSSTVSKAVSLCLSDYVSVVPNTLYKLEIIDVTESKLLDVAYFSSRRGYQKSDSGYGTKISDYDNSGNLDNDIDNNNGYSGGSSSNGGKLDTDNPNDIIDTDYNNSLANINISDIIVSLRTSIASVGVFFQSCWALFPPAIWSIILLGLSLIVVLRLLGR